jgi:hypothetical protein
MIKPQTESEDSKESEESEESEDSKESEESKESYESKEVELAGPDKLYIVSTSSDFTLTVPDDYIIVCVDTRSGIKHEVTCNKFMDHIEPYKYYTEIISIKDPAGNEIFYKKINYVAYKKDSITGKYEKYESKTEITKIKIKNVIFKYGKLELEIKSDIYDNLKKWFESSSINKKESSDIKKGGGPKKAFKANAVIKLRERIEREDRIKQRIERERKQRGEEQRRCV